MWAEAGVVKEVEGWLPASSKAEAVTVEAFLLVAVPNVLVVLPAMGMATCDKQLVCCSQA